MDERTNEVAGEIGPRGRDRLSSVFVGPFAASSMCLEVQSSPDLRRSAFFSDFLRFTSRRLALAARDGFVFLRTFGTVSAFHPSSASGPPASSRLPGGL